MEEIAMKTRETISKTLAVELDKITDDATLADDLGADSLDMAELGMAIQEAFQVEITDAQMAQIRTVKDVIQALATAKTAV